MSYKLDNSRRTKMVDYSGYERFHRISNEETEDEIRVDEKKNDTMSFFLIMDLLAMHNNYPLGVS